jgi:hypothetical protein
MWEDSVTLTAFASLMSVRATPVWPAGQTFRILTQSTQVLCFTPPMHFVNWSG